MPIASSLRRVAALGGVVGGLGLAPIAAHADAVVPCAEPCAAVALPAAPVPAPAVAPAPAPDPTAKPAAQHAGCAGVNTMPTPANIAAIRHTTLCLLNRIRRAHHRHRLRNNLALQLVAQRYSQLMVADRFFDHVSPTGSTFVQRIRQTHYLASAASWSLGENLAWGSGFYATPRETVNSWMHSTGHRHNILEPRYREIGIGVAPGTPTDAGGVPGATYTTEFGKRSTR
jgi:uncharacterized protein YkwD